MRPINVLHLRDTHEIGGPGKTILETFRAIDAARFRPQLAVFLTRHETGESPFVSAAKDAGMPVHYVRGYNQFDLRLISRVVALVKAQQIDIISAHEVKSDVIAWLARVLHHVPIVTTLHGWIGNKPRQRAFIALDKWVVRKFDRVIVVSAKIQQELIAAGVPPDKLRLVHNAIVLERYRRTGRRGALAQLLGRELPGPVAVSIGRISPEKGHLDLVEALGIVARRGRPLSTVLIGDGPARAQVAERVRALGLDDSVHMPGYLAQPERFLEDVDLMALPSHTEGLPNVVLEALAMDVPVVATRVGGTPEIITDHETGRLVPPHDPEAMAEALLSFMQDPAPWQAMARRGHRVVQDRFSFEQRTRTIEGIYSELAGGRA
ncbi:MAG: glycosyltransferase family 4 protein [Vicinamibacteraceae bacterium]